MFLKYFNCSILTKIVGKTNISMMRQWCVSMMRETNISILRPLISKIHIYIFRKLLSCFKKLYKLLIKFKYLNTYIFYIIFRLSKKLSHRFSSLIFSYWQFILIVILPEYLRNITNIHWLDSMHNIFEY